MVDKWRKKLNEEGEPEKAFPGKGNVRDAEMKAMKRRLDRLEEENAILEKAISGYSTAPVEPRPR
ncbi:transposase-like protein [Salinibacter ruber]|nr:transposase-like protein [Salinibacter ruber]